MKLCIFCRKLLLITLCLSPYHSFICPENHGQASLRIVDSCDVVCGAVNVSIKADYIIY